MPHEISDAEARTWSYVQAFAGFGNDPEKANTARVHGKGGRSDVVCPRTAERSSSVSTLRAAGKKACPTEGC